MFQFARLLTTLFPTLSFYWLGGRFLWVGRTYLEYDIETNRTTERFEHLGYLVRMHASPCWTAFEADDGGMGEWEWQSRLCYSTQAAVEELLKHRGQEWSVRRNAEVNALVLAGEEELLREDERLGVHA